MTSRDGERDCRCGRPLHDQATFCDHCADQLAKALGETPWLTQELDTTIAGRKGIDYRRSGGSRPSETPLPVNLAASDLRIELKAVLTSWVKFCHDEDIRHQSPHPGLPADNTPAMSRWLLWRVDGLALHDIGPDAVDEITTAVGKAKRLVDRRPDKWFAGPCDCGVDLYARTQVGNVSCSGCGSVYDIAARRAWLLASAEDRLASAAEIARAVSWLGTTPLTPERVRQWAARDRIFARGHDGKSPLYRIGDAIDLLASRAQTG